MVLDITGNEIYRSDLSNLGALINLRELTLTYCSLRSNDPTTRTGPSFLTNLTKLASLNTWCCAHIDANDLQAILQLRELRELVLSGELVTSAFLQQYAQQRPNLTSLTLFWCKKVDDTAAQSLQSLHGLTYLNVSDTAMSPSAIGQLRAHLPNVKIV